MSRAPTVLLPRLLRPSAAADAAEAKGARIK
jgi:hypothetical protein